jgi:long-subunit fatty acid transport protein
MVLPSAAMSRVSGLALLVCASAAHALASPRTDSTVGRAVFTGAATANATSIDLNPAALGLGVKTEIYLAALGVVDRYAIETADASITDYTLAPGGQAAFIWHTGGESRITLALQLAKVSPADRFLEHEALRYHTLGGYHLTVSPLTIAASLRLTERIHVGVSIGGQSTFMKLRYARDSALDAGRDPDRGVDSDCGDAPCGIGNPLAAERYQVEASSGLFSTDVITANLGLVARVAREVWLGLAYHAPPGLAVQNELTGTMQVRRSPRDGGERLAGASTVYISQPMSFDAELRARVRDDLDVHVGGRWEHLSRFQAYDVRGYGSTFGPVGIPEWQPRPRGFENTFALWGGVEQVERDVPVIFGGRIGVESRAVPDARTSPLTIAPTSLTLDGGVQWRFADHWVLQATYGLQFFPRVRVTDSAFDPLARLACIDANYDYTTDACAAVRTGYAIPSAAGSYSRHEHAMRLAVRIELD